MTSCPHQGMSEIEFRYSFLWDKEKGSDLVQDPILFYLQVSNLLLEAFYRSSFLVAGKIKFRIIPTAAANPIPASEKVP